MKKYLIRVCKGFLFMHLITGSSYGNVYTVINTSDSGAGSLRQAIIDANSNSGKDSIDFNISGQAPHAIIVNSVLPVIWSSIIIDGTTQPSNGYAGMSPKIIIDGSQLSNTGISQDGVYLAGDNSEVYGLYIKNFPGIGIMCYTGRDSLTIGGINKGNLISGNLNAQIMFNGSNDYIDIKGNKIGTDTSGTISGATTIYSGGGIYGNSCDYVTIGGKLPGEGNIISGNKGSGVVLNGNYLNIWGNYIGTDVTGAAKLANNGFGIALSGGYILIGGSLAGERNIISGNDSAGIRTFYSFTPFIIKGNYIGVDVSGVLALPNGLDGIICLDVYGGLIIGGALPGEGNIISGNLASGINIPTFISSSLIRGNKIGVDKDNDPLGNAGSGIEINNAILAPSLKIDSNVIANNSDFGIVVDSLPNVMIAQNSIYCNANGGIKFNSTNKFPSPVITNITATNITGTAQPNASVEIFYDDSCSNCEGKIYLATVFANSSGIWTYAGSSSGNITATATSSATSKTSEFAICAGLGTNIREDGQIGSIIVYPNPVQSSLHIDMGNRYKHTIVNVLSVNGQEILTENFYESRLIDLDVNGLVAGIYLIHLSSDDKHTVLKLNKQ